MRIWLKLLVFIALTSCKEPRSLTIQERFEQSYHNFIPIEASSTPNYWSTYGVQCYSIDTNTLIDKILGTNEHIAEANQLTEANIFGKGDLASYFPKVAKDLYILFDLGWNVTLTKKNREDQWLLGSFELAEDKFPSCTGTPVERLNKLNNLCKEAGWKGAGLRIAAHPSGAAYALQSQMEEIRKFYYEKMSWCSKAGIEYWKVDDGFFSGNLEFRKMLTTIAREVAPNLTIEHIQNIAPLNDYYYPNDTMAFGETGTFKEWGNGALLQNSIEAVNFSDVFHIYHVTPQLSASTSLERVAQILNQFTEPSVSDGIINCGDEVYLAAALGCSMGITRHALFIEIPGFNYDPFSTRNRIDEIFRAVRWQRIAPAFGAGRTPVYTDSRRFSDSWAFNEGDSWANWITGDTVIQKAPARISRGMPLPKVQSDGELGYVACSKYPNGAIALATLPRVSVDSGLFYPLMDIEIEVDNWNKPIAIFGKVKSLTIEFSKLPRKYVVWGQDLAANRAVRITDLIDINKNTFKLSGKLISEIGLLASTPNDRSYPAMMLLIDK